MEAETRVIEGILVTKPQLQKTSTTDFRNMRLRKEDADKKEAVNRQLIKKQILEAVEVPKEI
jgi:hypothetical protein